MLLREIISVYSNNINEFCWKKVQILALNLTARIPTAIFQRANILIQVFYFFFQDLDIANIYTVRDNNSFLAKGMHFRL